MKLRRMLFFKVLQDFKVVVYVEKNKTTPIYQKCALTIEEAADYSNIGQNKLSELLKNPRCNFVLYVGKKK